MRFAVCCRGSTAEGLGHLYRAHSFVRVASRRHAVDLIVLAEPDFAPIFSGLDASVRFVASEAELAREVAAVPADATFLDMIDIGDEAFETIRAASPILASISPIFRLAGGLDLLFTRARTPPQLSGPEIYAGLEYAIVNDYCRPIPQPLFEAAVGSPILPVMVSFGGADADNHTRLVLEVLRDVKQPLLLWLMLGDGYLHSHDELVDTIRSTQMHEIILARTNRSMWRVASNCALAILTGGMSTLEAAFAGLPVISVRREVVGAAQLETDYDRLLADGGNLADGSYKRISRLVSELHADRGRIVEMREKQKGMIDALGADRIIAIVERRVGGERGSLDPETRNARHGE